MKFLEFYDRLLILKIMNGQVYYRFADSERDFSPEKKEYKTMASYIKTITKGVTEKSYTIKVIPEPVQYL